MKIASIQLNICWENKSANFERARLFVKKAKKDHCDLIIFPEMFNTGFSMNSNITTEPAKGETSIFLCQLAKEYEINLIAGFVERHKEKDENIAFFVNKSGEIKSRYVKNYPYSYAGENKVYSSGKDPVIFDLENHPATSFICYDLRFPELFRKIAKQVEIIIVIANWPVARQMHWENLLKARAIENQCFVVGVNRIGKDGNNLEYGGASLVCSPSGESLSKGDNKQEYILTEINLLEVCKIRKTLPFLYDMKDF